jgi:hypothetical protein
MHINACYWSGSMMHIVHIINYWCMLHTLSISESCYRFMMHRTLCDSPSALRNRLKPSVRLIIRWSISYTCYMLLDTCLLSSYWSMLHALHDIDRHATVYMLSRMYVLRVMWSMYDMLQIYDSLYTCKSMCAINLCIISVQHTYGTYYQLYCMLHML